MYGASTKPKTWQQMMESLKTGGFTQTVGGKKVFTPVMKATKMSGGVPVVQKGYKVPEGFAQTGQMASGQPVYTQMQIQQPTAAQPKPAPAAETPVEETKVEVTPETKALQDETKKILDELATTKKDLEDSQKQFELYKEEQAKIKAEQESTAAAQFANQAKAGLAPTLQIGGAAAGPMKTGTSAFKIKKPKTGTTSTINPLNIGSSSTLNV